jgi:methylenetetrahydrofolate reductase (NADPH)
MVTPVESTTMRRTSLSIELFPPKDSEGEERLWRAVDQLKALEPDFVSVTYGAGGSTRDRTIRIAEEFTTRTGVSTVAHLTCVGSTRDELVEILRHYKRSGITSVLALRGDPTGGPRAPWVSTPGGFDHADQLVELAREEGGLEIGVAAFPDGHPGSRGNFENDIETLIRKEQLGATFAMTQFFFTIESYDRLVERLALRGSQIPVIAGILPVTNYRQLTRMAELSGTPIPQLLLERFEAVESDPDALRKVGIEIATDLSQELLKRGVAGLHFYAMNTATATLEIAQNLGLDPRESR